MKLKALRWIFIYCAVFFVAVGETQAQSKDKIVIPYLGPDPSEERGASKSTAPWLTQEIEFFEGKLMSKVTLAPGVILKRIRYNHTWNFSFTLVNRRQQPLPKFSLRITFIDREGDPTPRPFLKVWNRAVVQPRMAADYQHRLSRQCHEISKAAFAYNLK